MIEKKYGKTKVKIKKYYQDGIKDDTFLSIIYIKGAQWLYLNFFVPFLEV